MTEIDRGRFEIWSYQTLVDATARDGGSVSGDVATGYARCASPPTEAGSQRRETMRCASRLGSAASESASQAREWLGLRRRRRREGPEPPRERTSSRLPCRSSSWSQSALGPSESSRRGPRITDVDDVQLPVATAKRVFPFDFSRSGSSTPFSWTFVPE